MAVLKLTIYKFEKCECEVLPQNCPELNSTVNAVVFANCMKYNAERKMKFESFSCYTPDSVSCGQFGGLIQVVFTQHGHCS